MNYITTHYILFLILLTGCLANNDRRTIASNEKRIIDFHAHIYSHIDSSEVINKLKSNVSKAILLSTGYSWMDLNKVKIENNYTSDIAKKSNNFGLCGANLLKQNFNIELKRCLKLENMIGVKLHPWGNLDGATHQIELSDYPDLGNVGNKKRRKKLIDIIDFNIDLALSLLDKNGGIALIHLHKKIDNSYLERLLTKFKNLKIVIAHGGAASSLKIDKLNRFPDKNGTPRLYIETSLARLKQNLIGTNIEKELRLTIYDLGFSFCKHPAVTKYTKNLILNDWKSFGYDRLLFGSDDGYGNWPLSNLLIEREIFNCYTDIINGEKLDKIMFKNAEKILSSFE